MTAVQEKTQAVANKRLVGKLALVTGGSRGIGAAIALRLAAEGATVVVNYSKSKDAADRVVEQAKDLGAKALAVKGNVSSDAESKALLAEVAKLGKIDILVNNAAVWEGGSIEEVTLESYDRLFNTNVRGVVATTIAALPHFNNGGRIINISSVASHAAVAGFSLYSATKGALDTLTRGWAQDLGKRQITVNAVAPGTTLTEMLEQAMDENAKKFYTDKTALGRLGEPSDIADVVAFLASPDSRWVTGQIIDAHGGLAF